MLVLPHVWALPRLKAAPLFLSVIVSKAFISTSFIHYFVEGYRYLSEIFHRAVKWQLWFSESTVSVNMEHNINR